MDDLYSRHLLVRQIILRTLSPPPQTQNRGPRTTSFFPLGVRLLTFVCRIITGRRADGGFDLLHQNVNGVRKVQNGELILDEMVSGKLWIYRPVWESWAGSMEPKWDSGW
jgi:hypothetical protein